MSAALRSAQTPGRSSFFTPSRSTRWPPVILPVGILYLSATSAMARSSLALVIPLHMRGTTAYEPRPDAHTSDLQLLLRISYADFCLLQTTFPAHPLLLQPQMTQRCTLTY